MWKQLILLVLLPASILCCASGCSWVRKPSSPQPPGLPPSASPPPPPSPPAYASDVVDKDFAASIRRTKQPNVFIVEVRRVNPGVQKLIDPVMSTVSCDLRDARGRIWEPSASVLGLEPGKAFATEVSPTDLNESDNPITRLSSRLILHNYSLPAGSYTVIPDVRIVETGRDAIHGNRPDGGTVAVPARNTATLIIK